MIQIVIGSGINVTGPAKTAQQLTESILFACESYTHALTRNTKYLTKDGQVCFHRRLFADAVEPRGCISQP